MIPNGDSPPQHGKKVIAIVSAYDGTLVPTTAALSKDGKNKIPDHLENLLSTIAKRIPVCILSSKDYGFLHDKVPFANIISCILGIETLVVSRDQQNLSPQYPSSNSPHDIISRHLLVNDNDLARKDSALIRLAEDLSSQLPELTILRKYTLDGLLAGITFDWRDRSADWSKYSNVVPAYVRRILSHTPYNSSSAVYLQSYDSHPFIDVYSVECDKGMGFDCIIEELSYHNVKGSILYLGDSENDNPAFVKSGISMGVISDKKRDSSKLKCDYLVEYDRLADFLELLMDNDFVFSGSIWEAMKAIVRQRPGEGKNDTTGGSRKDGQ